MECVFCQIASGAVAARKIYEDDRVVAILDINPASPGHTLIIPKSHYAVAPLIPEDLAVHIALVAKMISRAALKGLKAAGTNIAIAVGAAAGQRAPHVLVHVIPRQEGDGVLPELPRLKLEEAQLEQLKQRLK